MGNYVIEINPNYSVFGILKPIVPMRWSDIHYEFQILS